MIFFICNNCVGIITFPTLYGKHSMRCLDDYTLVQNRGVSGLSLAKLSICM